MCIFVISEVSRYQCLSKISYKKYKDSDIQCVIVGFPFPEVFTFYHLFHIVTNDLFNQVKGSQLDAFSP